MYIKGLHFFISQNIDGGGGKGKGLMVARLVHYPTAELRRALVLGGKGALTRAASMQTDKGAISIGNFASKTALCARRERKVFFRKRGFAPSWGRVSLLFFKLFPSQGHRELMKRPMKQLDAFANVAHAPTFEYSPLFEIFSVSP